MLHYMCRKRADVEFITFLFPFKSSSHSCLLPPSSLAPNMLISLQQKDNSTCIHSTFHIMTPNGRSSLQTGEAVKRMTAVTAWPFQIVCLLMPDTSFFSGWHLAEPKRFGESQNLT